MPMIARKALIVDNCSMCGKEIYEHELHYTFNGRTVCETCESRTRRQEQEVETRDIA